MDAVMNGTASMEFESDYYTFFSFVFWSSERDGCEGWVESYS
jgi:hypothetical protein